MKQLLIVAHCPSANTQVMLDAMVTGIAQLNLDNCQVLAASPFDVQPQDVLDCDGIILFTPENLGYMSGALKDFFDRIYYPCLEIKQGLPCAVVIRAGQDGTGTERALNTILTGLKWRMVQAPLICKGPWQTSFIAPCCELAQAMAMGLSEGMI